MVPDRHRKFFSLHCETGPSIPVLRKDETDVFHNDWTGKGNQCSFQIWLQVVFPRNGFKIVVIPVNRQISWYLASSR